MATNEKKWLQNSGSKRGAIPIEMLALLVVGLVVLVVVVLFFKGGLGEIGKKFGQTSGGIKSQTGAVTDTMSKATTPLYQCDSSKGTSSSCSTFGGFCETSHSSCAGKGGTDDGYVHGCFGTNPVCCCMSVI